MWNIKNLPEHPFFKTTLLTIPFQYTLKTNVINTLYINFYQAVSKEGFAKSHQTSSRTLIRDLQNTFQFLNDIMNLSPMLSVGFSTPFVTVFGRKKVILLNMMLTYRGSGH